MAKFFKLAKKKQPAPENSLSTPLKRSASTTIGEPVLLAPPFRRYLLAEGPRTAGDLARMLRVLAQRQQQPKLGNGRRVLVVPGFGGGDAYTYWLRRFLDQHGYKTEGWNLGINRGGDGLKGEVDFYPVPEKYRNGRELEVPLLAMLLRERAKQRANETGEKFAIVGHSLGGYLAREVARQAPEAVDQLITFGSPVYGGPKYTAVGKVFARRGVDIDWIESVVAEREQLPIDVPITTIVSPTDAIVAYQSAIDRSQPHAKLIEISAGHTGMAFNPAIWRLVLGELAAAN